MNFRLKTILGIACIEALLLLALVISSLVYLRDSNEQELQRRAAMAATLFATATKDAVLSTDLARLEQLAADLLKNPGLLYVRIADNERLLVQAGSTDVLQRPFRADDKLDLVDDGIYDAYASIREAGQDYGRIELGLSIEAIQAVINEARQRIISLAVLEMTLVALFSWLLGGYLTRQLSDLEKASNNVTQGEFHPKLPVRGNDELARVAKAFNSMSERLGVTYRALQVALADARQRGEHLQTVVDSVLDGLVAIDIKGSITLFSRSAEQIFGYLSEEVIGHNVNMLMPEPYHSAHDHYLKNLRDTGQKSIIGIIREVQGLRKDGTIFPMDLSITELRTAGEKGYIGLVRDISEPKQLTERLRGNESMKKAMLESSLDAIITIDSDGRICDFNQTVSTIFGYTLNEITGELMAELFMTEKYRTAFWQGIQCCLNSGERRALGRRIEISGLRRSGAEFPMELNFTPICLNEHTFFVVFLRDISEIKASEQALRLGQIQAEQANQVKSQFLAIMSHEIRTPLNIILGTQDLLADTTLDATQQKHLKLARDAGKSLLNLINDILDLTKVEAEKLELETTVFDPVTVVEDVLQLVDINARKKKLALTFTVAPEVASWVSGDSWRLRQVLLNLLTNAIKFTPSGSITVKLSQRSADAGDGLLLFEVIDTGIGIAEDVQPHLFEVFIQADPSDTRKYGGSGLGLAISKRLVKLWGGHMGVESHAGIGSRFWFSFGSMAEAMQTNVSIDQSAKKNPASTSAADILLVEDSLVNQTVLSAMLRSGGHSVDVADCGAAAIAAVKSHRYELIFMDASMPDMSGMDATRTIRQLGEAAARVPIIAITAHAIKGYRDQCINAGMNGYATKPISKKDLLALVDQWRSPPESAPDSNITAEAETTRVLLDEAVLCQVAEDADMDDVTELLHIFLDELNVRRDAIQGAVEQQNLILLGHEAHTLKSGAATFGAWSLHALAVDVDNCCKRGDLAAALVLSERLLCCAELTLAAVVQRCAG